MKTGHLHLNRFATKSARTMILFVLCKGNCIEISAYICMYSHTVKLAFELLPFLPTKFVTDKDCTIYTVHTVWAYGNWPIDYV